MWSDGRTQPDPSTKTGYLLTIFVAGLQGTWSASELSAGLSFARFGRIIYLGTVV